ncbi:Helicase conserved C-terminal domain [Ceratobasidium sp. AG-Ba]|nr:Helicase conserved C-terminal domain [Ceratobasidium sp. AG-Ba]
MLAAQTAFAADVRLQLSKVLSGNTELFEQDQIKVQPKHLTLLRRWTRKSQSIWKSAGQAKAISAILDVNNHYFLVEPGITLLFMPLLALKQTQTTQMISAGVPVHAFNANRVPADGLVVASIETLKDPDTVLQWCFTTKAQHRLKRIMMDEAHLVITSDFREVMQETVRLVEVGVPVVALSATVPPLHEPRLKHAFGDPDWTVVREPTQRPNIAYYTAEYLSPELALKALKKHLQHFVPLLGEKEVLLVNCRTIPQVHDVSSATGFPGYWASLDPDQKTDILDSWLTSKTKVIVASAALGVGIHHDSCVGVFHYGVAWGSIEYAQETGRAGRNNQPSLAIMFHWGIDFKEASPPTSPLAWMVLITWLLALWDTCPVDHAPMLLKMQLHVKVMISMVQINGQVFHAIMHLMSSSNDHGGLGNPGMDSERQSHDDGQGLRHTPPARLDPPVRSDNEVSTLDQQDFMDISPPLGEHHSPQHAGKLAWDQPTSPTHQASGQVNAQSLILQHANWHMTAVEVDAARARMAQEQQILAPPQGRLDPVNCTVEDIVWMCRSTQGCCAYCLATHHDLDYYSPTRCPSRAINAITRKTHDSSDLQEIRSASNSTLNEVAIKSAGSVGGPK